MKLLHIGDYHFKAKANNYEQNLMIDKMIDSLSVDGNKDIDFVLFTGDLVFSGEIYEDFEKAHNSLFQKLFDRLGILKENVVICPGNHDIDRGACSEAIINFFDEKITTNDALNEMYTKSKSDFTTSLNSITNYYKYASKYHYLENDIHDKLFTVQKRKVGENSIGFVTLNTAWLSSGFREDLNHLMFPSSALKKAITEIDDTNCKIILLHHPLNNFKEFNAIEIEDLIHKEFNLMFLGHIHREQISTMYVGGNGIYSNTTQATLTFDRTGQIGYSIITFDLSDGSEIKIERSSYNSKEHIFQNSTPVMVSVPCGIDKANQNKLRGKITSKFRVELTLSNELLLEYDDKTGKNFLDLFTQPVLSTNNEAESSNSANNGLFNYETLLSTENNYLIFGKDKCGKTSLLKRIQLHLLKNYSLFAKVPFYINYKYLETRSPKIDIIKLIRNYYEISQVETEKLVSEGHLILLIDNLDNNSGVHAFILDFLEKNQNVQFIICSENLASRVYFEELDHLDYEKLYFKNLSRKEIRLYTEKHPTSKAENKEEVLDRIAKVCQQLQLPINYWTISLILLIYKKSNDDINRNLFGILDLCVDEILQKKQLTVSKNILNFEQYKEVCSQIAYFLLTSHKEDIYSAPYITIINFIDHLISSNPRLVNDPKEIFDFLNTSGILRERGGRYTFRLNGLFEYFLAYYINHHKDFKNEILLNDNIYLSFQNELEIYSGFNRADEDFLKQVFDKTKNIFDPIINKNKEYGSIDNILMQKLGAANSFADTIRKLRISKPLSHHIQDQLMDDSSPLPTESEVHLKELMDLQTLTPEILEKYLLIIARVFKNSDNIKNLDLIYSIFDFLLEAYCNFGFQIIDSFSNLAAEGNKTKYDEDPENDKIIGEQMLKMVTNFIPLLTQILLFDGLGHANLQKIINRKIDECKKDVKNNQYNLYLLYFLLIDTDLKNGKKYIDELFATVTLSPLKVSTFFKLNFYLAFKAYNNSEMEQYLKNKVQEAQLRMDNKTDSDKLNSFLSRKQKGNILRRHINK